MDEDPLQQRIYFLNFMDSLKIVISMFKQTCMLLVNYLSIEG